MEIGFVCFFNFWRNHKPNRVSFFFFFLLSVSEKLITNGGTFSGHGPLPGISNLIIS